jgi:hypothetical protein
MKQFMSDSDSLKGYYIGFNSFVFLGVHSTFKCFIFQPYGVPNVASVSRVIHYLFQSQFPYPTAWQHRQRTCPERIAERIANNTVTPKLGQSTETNENQTFPESEEWEDQEPTIREVSIY